MAMPELLRKCRLEMPSACGKCIEEGGGFFCGLSPLEKAKREKGHVIGGFLMKETRDSINQKHNPWCAHYYTEWAGETFKIIQKK